MQIITIFEDEHILVIEKPSGIASQPDKTNDESILSLLEKRYQYIGLVHRLDRNVGGVMIFAKTKQATAELSKQIQEKIFVKQYLAVVCGNAEDEKTLKNYLIKNQRLNFSKCVAKNTRNAKEAVLSYKCIKRFSSERDESLSLIKINLQTGRHHQIRVQTANEGIPIWGDTKYNPNFRYKKGFTNLALWASSLEIRHPKTKQTIQFESKPHEIYPFNVD